ncbi:ATP-dependent RNA helicase DeaD [Methylorubrum extorquens]|uniref:DEAD/DEAH box helicase n=1 Tax=Methylorubrum extorquens TaxID=408 RepID=UPI0020A09B28|nr:DEAD/DEAH box helicase [Methylorubrum extorquens]MCP1557742.1 ATP-dependent RNA helicase DeaD [Methylorubrum extorquens]MDF9791341.1 ATP-dependent RNA helicase DeaD [Methylorubrum extorquens]MDF9863039.1 ATP-dependent RNA helicase DeaD [Methylorubrum pseudosasae]MDH6665828.1 ATP-dependent RNA helicase DeaD [Methylorubrum zatmanii]
MPFPSLPSPLARALTERNYAEPTPVQQAVLDAVPERDLLVSAQTGSGKTVAFGLAIAGTLLGEDEALPPPGAPLALVIAPTRELALQVQRELTWLYAQTGARIVPCVGGMDPRREARALEAGVHIVVGTPGRLRDHMERGRLVTEGLRAVILDEADEMLDMGFREDLEFILASTPKDRRTLLFSATLPKAIVALAESYQRDALRLAVAGETRGHADIVYRAVRVMPREVEHAVVNILRYVDAPVAIVFCNTRDRVRHLQASLTERGFSAVALSGELGQGERNAALQALRDGRARVCVATDVAARGIDLPGLDLVIHADLPHDAEVMQHRSGRTGRAGRKGTSVVLVPPAKRRRAEQMFAIAKVSPDWSGPPNADEIRILDRERMMSDPLLAEPETEEDREWEREWAEALMERCPPERLAAAFARLYRSRIPVPEEVSDPAYETSRRPDSRSGVPVGASRVGDDEPAAWFRLNLGRRDRAEPRRLLPMLTRRGQIGRGDIGSIRIFDNETTFEVRASAADDFAASFARRGPADVRVERMQGDGPAAAKAPKSPRAQRHRREATKTGRGG